MAHRSSVSRLAGILIAAVTIAVSASASVSAASVRPAPVRKHSQVTHKQSAFGHAAALSLRVYAKGDLLARMRRASHHKLDPPATRPNRPVPQPQPQPQPPAPTPPQPQPQPPAPTPPVGATGGFGVSLDNPEYLDASTRNREFDSMTAMGARWIRFDVKWSDVQWDGPASFNWSKYDPLVDGARARGLTVLANLAYSPTWARPAGTTDKFAPDTAERRRAYAAFAEEAIRHFAGRVSHWELWNEPNIPMFWAPNPNAAAYSGLIRESYPRMKAIDPNAYILAGATSPASSDGTAIDEVAFLSTVYANGGKGFFDGWSHHPYTVDPSFAHPDNAWWQLSGTSPSIRSVMTANGDGGKQVWGTEFGPPTSGAPNAMSEQRQADQITEAYTTWNAYPWAGPLFVYTQRDKSPYGASSDSFQYYGMLRYDFSPKPVWSAYRALAT